MDVLLLSLKDSVEMFFHTANGLAEQQALKMFCTNHSEKYFSPTKSIICLLPLWQSFVFGRNGFVLCSGLGVHKQDADCRFEKEKKKKKKCLKAQMVFSVLTKGGEVCWQILYLLLFCTENIHRGLFSRFLHFTNADVFILSTNKRQKRWKLFNSCLLLCCAFAQVHKRTLTLKLNVYIDIYSLCVCNFNLFWHLGARELIVFLAYENQQLCFYVKTFLMEWECTQNMDFHL